MKKVFTLLLLCFAFSISMQAQIFLFEDFEDVVLPAGWIRIDNDGDGHNWDPLIGFPGYNSSSSIASSSYNGGALTPDNWLITKEFTLTADATLTFYVSGYDAEYNQEHYSVYLSTTGSAIADFTTLLLSGTTSSSSYEMKSVDLSNFTGQTVRLAFRHHDCTDQYWLRLDAVKVYAAPAGPAIEVLQQEVDFGDVSFPGCHHSSIDVSGYQINGSITATTSAPFSVSVDGVNYSTSAVLANTTGRIHIRYNPTVAGLSTGTITLSNPGASNTTVDVRANAYDCKNTSLPYVFDFNDVEKAKCWSTVDANNDAAVGGYGEFEIATDYGYAVYGFTSNNADDWLISPSFNIGHGAVATFQHSATANMTGYVAEEKYEVYVIPDGQTYENAILVVPAQATSDVNWNTQEVSLYAFEGQTLQVAIRVVSDANAFVLGIAHFTLNNEVGVDDHNVQSSIYPNPANNTLHVSVSSPMNSISIYSLSGQLLSTQDVDGRQANLNVSNLSNGLYLLKIFTENGIVNRKFNIVR